MSINRTYRNYGSIDSLSERSGWWHKRQAGSKHEDSRSARKEDSTSFNDMLFMSMIQSLL